MIWQTWGSTSPDSAPYQLVGDKVPQTPFGFGTITPGANIYTKTQSGRSCLHNSDLIPNREHMHAPNLFTAHFQNYEGNSTHRSLTGPQSGPESLRNWWFNILHLIQLNFIQVRFLSETRGWVQEPCSILNQLECKLLTINMSKRNIWYTNQPTTESKTHKALLGTMENNHPQPNTGKGGKTKTSKNCQDQITTTTKHQQWWHQPNLSILNPGI